MSKQVRSYKYKSRDWDESKSVQVQPKKSSKGISTSIRLPREMVLKLKKIARKKGDIGYQTLLKIWIAERLEKESA
ncbi:MAG: BrnA antitoxin family protein [Proteobacteria bacterium]|nr:BrnA antitoxin family protein [Pseudomonadota bacterium]